MLNPAKVSEHVKCTFPVRPRQRIKNGHVGEIGERWGLIRLGRVVTQELSDA